MSSRVIPSAFVSSVLNNGVGRYVCQLQRVTLKFCKSHAGSRGVRDFIENDLLEFTRDNPGIVVYLQPRRHRCPQIYAEFLNQNTRILSLQNLSQGEVRQWLELLRSQSGQDIKRIRKFWHTDHPSLQGIWTPFTNKDTTDNLTNFPDPSKGSFESQELSATEKLMKRAQKLRESANKTATSHTDT